MTHFIVKHFSWNYTLNMLYLKVLLQPHALYICFFIFFFYLNDWCFKLHLRLYLLYNNVQHCGGSYQGSVRGKLMAMWGLLRDCPTHGWKGSEDELSLTLSVHIDWKILLQNTVACSRTAILAIVAPLASFGRNMKVV